MAEEKARDTRIAAAGGDLPMGALGSGSDYTPFLRSDYLWQLRKLVVEKRAHVAELDRLLAEKAFELAADPTRVVLAPQREEAMPEVDFTQLESAIARLKTSARAYDAAFGKLVAGERKLSATQCDELNRLLQGMEQKLTDARGLPGRDWFRHFIYAPGVLTGYGVKTPPGVRAAIEGARWAETNQYSALTAQVLTHYCDPLDRATRLIERGT